MIKDSQAASNPPAGARRILYVQYTNPAGYPPLEHSSRMLADAGWSILFLGTGSLGSNALEFPAHPNIIVQQMAFRGEGWQQKLHYLRYSLRVLWTVLTWRPQWIYASDPLSCPMALLLTWIPGVNVIYHEHDSPPARQQTGWFMAAVMRARRSLAKRATICILPNLERLTRFASTDGPLRHASCVWNVPGLDEAASQPRGRVRLPIRILYHGSIVPDRLPLSVIDALALLPDRVQLRVVGYETVGSRGYINSLRERATERGVGDRVEFVAAMPRSSLMTTALQSDIGLALVPPATADENFQTMTGASNKAFDYMACGLALLVSDLPDWRGMFVDPGYGLACDPQDPHSVAAAIGWLIEHPNEMRTMGESGRKKILASWNYENVFRPVFDRITGCREGVAVS